jgi:nicotinamide-nucleotide amidase
MIAEIICVGTELLLGQITNTNARFLAETLAELGIDAYLQQVVGDNAGRLAAALRLALGRSDLVVTCGGLGPTEDDLTKETVGEVLGVPLAHDPVVADRITFLVERHGSQVLSRAVAKQAQVLEGARILPNAAGTAPGLLVSKGGRHVALLPGPPAELEPMVRDHLVPALRALTAAGDRAAGREEAGPGGGGTSFLRTRVVKLCGLGEPAVEEAVRDLIHSSNPSVAPLVTVGETHLRVTAKARSAAEAESLVAGMVAAIGERLGPCIFGHDDATIAGACGKRLLARGATLALAESLTGGLVGHLVTQVPGSSAYFERDLVVYSNRAKTELLGVGPELLSRHGAVSEEVALAMARGARQGAGTTLGLALTGIAGPDGGSAAKPVGLVYIAISDGVAGEECRRYVFSGDRNLVKQRAAHRSLVMLWEWLGRPGQGKAGR